MDNKDVDNKKLMDEIDSLDEENKYKIKQNKKGVGLGKILLVIIIIIFIIMAYMHITKERRIGKQALSDFEMYFSENGDEFLNDNLEEDYNEIEYENDEFREDIPEEYDEQEKEENAKFEAQKANIKITKEFRDVNKNLGIVLNNQNQENITDILVQVIFYNAENKPIKIDEAPVETLKNNLDYYIVFEETPDNFEKYEFLITKEYYGSNYDILNDDITYDVKDTGEDEIVIKGKNNSPKKITNLEFFIVYYDDKNNILGVDSIYEYDIRKNGNFEIETYKYLLNDETYENVPFSRYEVILASAYNNNF